MIQTINPETGDLIRSYEMDSEGEVDQKLSRLEKGYKLWSKLTWEKRLANLRKVGEKLATQREVAAGFITDEMGKPINEARAEIDKCRSLIDYYHHFWPNGVQDEAILSLNPKVYVHHHPVGIVFGIMPWNFPFWQVFRFAVPALLMGNVVLLKHAKNTTGCSMLLQDFFGQSSGLEGVFESVKVSHSLAEKIIEHPGVAAVSVTGSSEAGKKIAERAGTSLKKCVLELGGSDPYVVFDDANLENAAKICAHARLLNCGQSCIAAKRFFVHRAVAKEFSIRMAEEFRSRRIGSPRSPDTNIGPMARQDLRELLHDQVRKSINEGAKLSLGGEIPIGPGFFYPPTILEEVTPAMTAFKQEMFGPVATITVFESDEEAVTLANNTPFGLGAALFSENVTKCEALARSEIQAGMVFINDFVRSDPRWPFGGIKDSGYGRELSRAGLLEFSNLKTIAIAGA